MTPWAGQTVRIVFEAADRRRGEHGRGGRRRRADHPPVGRGSRTRNVVPPPAGDSTRDRPAVGLARARGRWRGPSPEPRDVVALHEPVEDVRQQRPGRCPGPVSRDLETDQRRPSTAAADRHRAAGRRVAERVGDEVGEDLADPDRVDLEDRQVAVDGGGRASTPAAAAAGSNERTTSPTRTSGSVGSGWSGERPGLGQGERPQVVDEPLEDAGLVEDRARGAPRRPGRRRRRSPRGCPVMTASGVRSSWLTSASSVRRWLSSVSRRAAIVSKPRGELAGSAAGRDRVVPTRTRVVAVLDPRASPRPAGRASRAAPQQSAPDRDEQRRRRPRGRDDRRHRAEAREDGRRCRRATEPATMRKTSPNRQPKPALEPPRGRAARPRGRLGAHPRDGCHDSRRRRAESRSPPAGVGVAAVASLARSPVVGEAVADAVDGQDVARLGAGRARACGAGS